jgi:hypothetical protein
VNDACAQCAIPVFEGLFPDGHDNIIRVLLFRMAQWHALAKLRLHSEDTLALLDDALRTLANQLRHFQTATCSAFCTTELPSETALRRRREAGSSDQGSSTVVQDSRPRPKSLNLNTYKIHALGDYVHCIKQFGTTDSYIRKNRFFHRCFKRHLYHYMEIYKD